MVDKESRLRFESTELEPETNTSGQVGSKQKQRARNSAGEPTAQNTSADESTAKDTTSEQAAPRSNSGKYRQQSEQAEASEHSGFGEGGATVKQKKKLVQDDKKLHKSKLRMEKTGAKLDKAKGKLAKQKPLKKPGVMKKAAKKAGTAVWMYVHNKIRQVEQENVGTEAAHKTELVGERVVRGGARLVKKRIRTRPARQVRKWEKREVKANADYAYQKLVQESPELKSNPVSRFLQKQKLKKQYAKEARKVAKQGAKQGAKAAKKTTEKVASAVGGFVRKNPKVFLIILVVLLIVLLLQSCFGAMLSIGNGALGAVGGSSYLAEDAGINRVELAYTEWETDLQVQVQNAQRDRPGYDEYRYNVADISHNPYELLAFLTAVYDDFTFAGAEAVLREIFNEQYTLTFTQEIEVRYRTETRTDSDGDDYEVEVPYNWYILHVSLTAKSFNEVIYPRMNTEQRERYNIYMKLKGNRQYLSSPFAYNWLPYVTDHFGYRIHPTTGAKDYHTGLDIGGAMGTEILAGHDGVVTSAGNAGDYGLMVVLDDGEGLVSKYAHCSELSVITGQEVKAGDPIAKVGSTGVSTGPHLHLEIIKDGQYLNPMFFAVTGDFSDPANPERPEYGDPGVAMGDGSYDALIAEAERHLGKPYVFGSNGPDTFDCSSYVCWTFTKSGVYNLPRTTAYGIYQQCTPIALADARPGDLVFFAGTYSTTSPTSHIGIYVGGGMMIHAGNPIQYTSINTPYWQSHFYAFGRLPE